MQEGKTPQTRKRRLYTLAENVGDLSEAGNVLMVGSRVPESAIRRSAQLELMKNFDVLEPLPSDLSSEDVRLWQSTLSAGIDIPLDQHVTVLKVADALCDAHIIPCMKKLAAEVADVDWSNPQQEDATLCSLSRLPLHLLRDVMVHYLFIKGLSEAINLLPPALHTALLSADAARRVPSKTCELAFCHSIAKAVLPTIPSITVPLQGLLKIEISSATVAQGGHTCSPPSAGALLARAASAHPSLTSLSLKSAPLSPQWLRSFAACLTSKALPRLAELSLCVDAHLGGCAEVAACLRHLPSLTSLDVAFNLTLESTTATSSLSSYARLAANPSSLPKLQTLTYRDGCAFNILERQAANASFQYPYELRFRHSRQVTCSHAFLSLLSAPALTRLDLKVHTRLRMTALLAQVTRCTSLREISLIGTLLHDQLPLPEASSQIQLPALAKVEVASPCCTSPILLAAALAELGPASLTSIRLFNTHDDSYCDRGAGPLVTAARDSVGYRDEEVRDSDQEASHRLIDVLSSCTGLRSLQFCCMRDVMPVDQFELSDALSHALKQLQQLTELSFKPGKDEEARLDGYCVAEALRCLTALQRLELDVYIEFGEQQQVVIDACGELQKLTYLELSLPALREKQIAGILPKLSCLQRLQISTDEWAGDKLQALREKLQDVHREGAQASQD